MTFEDFSQMIFFIDFLSAEEKVKNKATQLFELEEVMIFPTNRPSAKQRKKNIHILSVIIEIKRTKPNEVVTSSICKLLRISFKKNSERKTFSTSKSHSSYTER
ncbi:hypothetical protein CDAR_176191 [Caerostris darwini]|uniref:Uncharacterized protein n=1 Tax=Caerostris darwini TaxID=1538125 RepID=A0AAV4NWZ6_9ARAC|nr:hypothetical protein CDAR_176191 [Caerostris darwini]